MKAVLLSLFALGLFAGCATQQQQVTHMKATGNKAIYTASYDQVWRAAVDTAKANGLQVTATDHHTGYIAGNLPVQPSGYTQQAGIWVRSITPTQTSVEMLRQPTGAPIGNWEQGVLSGIGRNLGSQVASQSGDVFMAGQEVINEPAGAARPKHRLIPEQGFPPFAPPAY